MKRLTKIDQIRLHPRPNGVVVAFKRAKWSNFSRRRFATQDLALAFADSLLTLANWRLAAKPPRRIARQPVTKRRISGGSVFWNAGKGCFSSSVYVGRDAKGGRILKVLSAATEIEARKKLDAFVLAHNSTL